MKNPKKEKDESFKKKQLNHIQNELKYLIAEGFVKKVGDKYRLKTQKELDAELKVIEKSF